MGLNRPQVYEFVNNLPDKESVVDIGCSGGKSLVYFINAGIGNALGIELVLAKVRCGLALGRNVIKGNVDLHDVWNRIPFNLSGVFMSHTFEHLRDPEFILRMARSRLKAKGIIYIVVPKEKYTERKKERKFERKEGYKHYNHFDSVEELESVCSKFFITRLCECRKDHKGKSLIVYIGERV